MHNRQQQRGSSQRGGRVPPQPRHMRMGSKPPMMPPNIPPSPPFPEPPSTGVPLGFPPAPNMPPMPPRRHPKEGMIPEPPPFPQKRPREPSFPKHPHPDPHFRQDTPPPFRKEPPGSFRNEGVPQFRKEFENKEFVQSQPIHLNKLIPMGQQFPGYMHPPPPAVTSNFPKMGEFGQEYMSSPFSHRPGIPLPPNEPSMPMIIPSPPAMFENLVPFPKAHLTMPEGMSPRRFMGYMDEQKFATRQPESENLRKQELGSFKQRLERFYNVLLEVNKVSQKIRFSVPSVFRIRVGYSLRNFEEKYLANVDSVNRYLLFLYLVNGYKEQLNFDVNKNKDVYDKELKWEGGKFSKFVNQEEDMALVSNIFLIGANSSLNTGDSSNLKKDNRVKKDKNMKREGAGSNNADEFKSEAGQMNQMSNMNQMGQSSQSSQSRHDYKLMKWDKEPNVTYTFNYTNSENNNLILLVRMVNINVLMNNIDTLKQMGNVYSRVQTTVMRMLGHYTLVCSDEDYITIISNLLPNLNQNELRMFYYNLSLLLDTNRCNLRLYYLERFIERFIPICLNQSKYCWRPVINNMIRMIDPVKISHKKYLNCIILMIRTLKSYTHVFVECLKTTNNIFLFCLRYLGLLLDDSKILIKSEFTDLLIQLFLNSNNLYNKSLKSSNNTSTSTSSTSGSNKNNSKNDKDNTNNNQLNYNNDCGLVMNCDVVKILGTLSGVQSIKLNIWSYLLSPYVVSKAMVDEGGSDKILSSGSQYNNVLNEIFCNNTTSSTSGTNNTSNSSNDSSNSSRSNNVNDLIMLTLTSTKEYKYLYNIFTQFQNTSSQAMWLESNNKLKVILVWFTNKFLRSNNMMFMYEKFSLLVRSLYHIYRMYLINSVNGDDLLLDNMVKMRKESSCLGVVIGHLLMLLLKNTNQPHSCLELANVKLSIVFDILLFSYKFNYNLVVKNKKKKEYIKINNNNYMNVVNTKDMSNMVLKNVNKMVNDMISMKVSNTNSNSGSNNNNTSNEKDNNNVNHLLRSTNITYNYSNVDSNTTTSSTGNNNNNNSIDVITNFNIIYYFLDDNDTEGLKMLLNYLENAIVHYNSDYTPVFYLDTITAFVFVNVTYALYYYKSELLDGRSFSKLEDVVNMVMKKSYLYKLLLLHVNVNNILTKEIITRVENKVYTKLITSVQRDTNLMKFILTQAYYLTLEYLYNYKNYYSCCDESYVDDQVSLVVDKNDVLFNMEMSLEDVINNMYNEGRNLVSRYILNRLYDEYKPPYYCLTYNTTGTGSNIDNSSNSSNTNNVDEEVRLFVNQNKCGFVFYSSNDTSNDSNNDLGENENDNNSSKTSISCVIDVLFTMGLYSSTNSNGVDDNMEEMILSVFEMVYRGRCKSPEKKFLNRLVLYELLYYAVKLVVLVCYTTPSSTSGSNKDSNNTSSNNVNADLNMYYKKMHMVLNMFNRLVDRVSSSTNKSYLYVINSMFNVFFRYFNNQEMEDYYRMEVKSVFEVILVNEFLWSHFSRYPVMLTSLFRLNSISSLTQFLSSFKELSIPQRQSQVSQMYFVNNLLNFTAATKVLQGSDLSNFTTSGSTSCTNNTSNKNNNSGNNTMTNTNNTFFSVSNNNLGLKNNSLLDILSGNSYALMVLDNIVNHIVLLNSTKPENVLEISNWFRSYFLLVQLLVRAYELRNIKDKVVREERNFYRSFKMSLVRYEQLNEFEYLTKDIILYLLDDKKITNDKNIVCYIGNDNNNSLFMYYMNGYTLYNNSTNLDGKNVNKFDEGNISVFLYLLHKMTVMYNSGEVKSNGKMYNRLLQVMVFSLYPLLVNITPNLNVFNLLYESLTNIIGYVNTNVNNSNSGSSNTTGTGVGTSNNNNLVVNMNNPTMVDGMGYFSNEYDFVINILLTVLFNWYYKCFFTYEFFVNQYNKENFIDKKYVKSYINKYLNNNNIEFNFNFTKVQIPVRHLFQLQLLF